ncbi:hypothetical protein EDD37DRAFT_260259 [Exophiala viscosa]|uniref:Calcineurin-like phosphoesterase domain-containing protein n=1 Tax=Exophiala viscosa TaxID=2486360 RepID=A0AAN6E6B2_9EURO|nr:hypothetical protein EDD36DRAFT_26049 [Exophiala viscosa]KAI1627397.1 hypothetical protein EDD37DRAFT_260259 [Exophiala viscosa]
MKTNSGIGSHNVARIKARIWNVPFALTLLWTLVLLWGERVAFQRTVTNCLWQEWESWPAHAQPHHVLLIADPQLVDPHTYPDRPWPLSTLTVAYTDRYLRRSYRYLQEYLRPDATLFLGDLFDGGREWGTADSSSPEDRYKKYGTGFWEREYVRFSNLFLRSWYKGSFVSLAEPQGRRILASLPGNHDLGFAAGIQSPVRERFDAFFGPLNRVDILGNHSFVHLDTVSLSAMDQIDPETGSSGAGDGSAAATTTTQIWKPVEEFLEGIEATRSKAIQHVCANRFGWKPGHQTLLSPEVESAARFEHSVATPKHHKELTSSQFPTIILSHVPLFRPGTTSCGPMRERGTAIPLQAGYQYQNVLTPLISQDIVKHLTAEEITMIYSGDDHDYCEIEHNEFTGRIREITVKSMSWAMGIRIPGVQLVSLWNPVDIQKVMSGNPDLATPRDTVQNHLCLLPNQLGIFIRYAQMLGLTLIVLAVYVIRYKPGASPESLHEKSEPLLPLSREHRKSDTSQTSSLQNQNQHLSTRKTGGYGNIPPTSRTGSPFKQPNEKLDDEDWGMPRGGNAAQAASKLRRPPSRLVYFGKSMWQVAWPVLLLYFWLIYTG